MNPIYLSEFFGFLPNIFGQTFFGTFQTNKNRLFKKKKKNNKMKRKREREEFNKSKKKVEIRVGKVSQIYLQKCFLRLWNI